MTISEAVEKINEVLGGAKFVRSTTVADFSILVEDIDGDRFALKVRRMPAKSPKTEKRKALDEKHN